MPNCLGRWVRSNILCTLFHLQTFSVLSCTSCTIQNISHHLFLPGISGCNQKNHFKCLCREIAYKGGGGMRSPTVDRDQRQQEATVSTIAGNREKTCFCINSSNGSWHPVSLTLRSQNHGVGRCSYCQPQGREWKRNTLVSSFPFSLLQPGSPLTSSRHKPAKRSSPWDMEQDRGRVKIDPEDTWAQALHVWPHSQAILREISPLILCSIFFSIK